jgi:hypothetical protein
MNNQFYIYIYEDENNVPIYVGKGKRRKSGIKERMLDHLQIAKRRKKPHPFYYKLKKMFENGLKPKIYKVNNNLTAEEANKIEKQLVAKIGRKDLNKGPLLNLCDGGEGLLNMSDAHKNIIRKTHTGKINSQEVRQKISNSKKNNTIITDEHRRKISLALKGQKCSKKSIEKRKNKRWVNNKISSLCIDKDKLDEYLKNGWFRGRHNYFSDESKEKMSISAKKRQPMSIETRKLIGSISKTKRWINNTIENKFVDFSEVELCLSQGWVKGQLCKKKRKKLC